MLGRSGTQTNLFPRIHCATGSFLQKPNSRMRSINFCPNNSAVFTAPNVVICTAGVPSLLWGERERAILCTSASRPRLRAFVFRGDRADVEPEPDVIAVECASKPVEPFNHSTKREFSGAINARTSEEACSGHSLFYPIVRRSCSFKFWAPKETDLFRRRFCTLTVPPWGFYPGRLNINVSAFIFPINVLQ